MALRTKVRSGFASVDVALLSSIKARSLDQGSVNITRIVRLVPESETITTVGNTDKPNALSRAKAINVADMVPFTVIDSVVLALTKLVGTGVVGNGGATASCNDNDVDGLSLSLLLVGLTLADSRLIESDAEAAVAELGLPGTLESESEHDGRASQRAVTLSSTECEIERLVETDAELSLGDTVVDNDGLPNGECQRLFDAE